ncbi:MAG: hypothetical protein UW35_C0008G0015 [Candidatus Collierbacteria bacterium GW2011_GWF2_44_15]|uniref:DUF5666 domain-containing protein n=4 Tax=Candidatus Collieribacteriota TaxID=1752725 RepID=A0A0G1HIN4_9BACT|nr:MAG: hypothetical protein UW23_C0012G0021 [Candidatus Collierbacteria bacterium GW2011_GWA1_44_12]KKT46790.1 MAG: hypothetical protein UW35_C0008G0015 [Candidatus Collierbacteria bacterium GW2011_GWF2_44_15]KKT97360.1 MAG: hypothetical protein UW99_C0034G0003 [Candidatus Collierbacteria bacterium GW2011_GWC2_45_15]KKU30370.1 MAG: hypothetical protein UX41_C0006G0013 [Candidatus Collierbacteria bacterium GW2011_GWE1_46_18]
MKNNILLLVIVGALALSSGFFAGTLYQKSQKVIFPQDMLNRQGIGTPAQNGTGIRNVNVRNGAPVNGKIISMDSTSITVQGTDGSNKIILLSQDTKINNTLEGTKEDLKVGSEVMIFGNTTNGAITAQSISLGRFMATPSGQAN